LFTHYTREIKAINGILSNCFAWIDNKRGELIKKFLPDHDFSEREPEQFGMISFTELYPHAANQVRNTFGNYGIIVTPEWAHRHGIQKVLYIPDKGPVFESFAFLFKFAYEDLKAKSLEREGEISEMSFTNRIRAAIAGGHLYSHLLKLYSFMEPINNAYQEEWRIVNPNPLYGFGKTKEDIIKNVSPPKGWAKFVHVLSIKAENVLGFVCPAKEKIVFQNELIEEYRKKEIYTF